MPSNRRGTPQRRTLAERAEARNGGRNRGRRKGNSQQPGTAVAIPNNQGGATVIQLPVFGDAATMPAGALPAVIPADAAPTTKPSKGERLRNWLWRHRWNLTPAAAGLAVLTVGVAAPMLATSALGALALAGEVTATRGPDRVRGRVWLSRKERTIVRNWAIAAGVWTIGAWIDRWGFDAFGALILTAATCKQSIDWVTSRRVRRTAPEPTVEIVDLAAKMRDLTAKWPVTVGGEDGHAKLKGSRIVAELTTYPMEGVVASQIELREDVHNNTAIGTEIRENIERRLRLPVNTVELAINPDDAAMVRVAIDAGRVLERKGVLWPGPQLDADGTFPFAATRFGDRARGRLREKGVGPENIAVFGASGGGKSFTAGVLVAPGVAAGEEVVWYADAAGGSSAAHLAHVSQWWACAEETNSRFFAVETAVRAFHAAMQYRLAELARRGTSLGNEWPIITLLLDEAHLFASWLNNDAPNKLGTELHTLVWQSLALCRKANMRYAMLSQDSAMKSIPGQREARQQLGDNGMVIVHRTGDATNANIAFGSVKLRVDDLPDSWGWARAARKGQPIVGGAAFRVMGANAEHYTNLMQGTHLIDVDHGTEQAVIDAVGDLYVQRETGPQAWDRKKRSEPEPSTYARATGTDDNAPAATGTGKVIDMNAKRSEVAQAANNAAATMQAALGNLNRGTILDTLDGNADGLTIRDIVEITGLSRQAVDGHLRALREAGEVTADTNTKPYRFFHTANTDAAVNTPAELIESNGVDLVSATGTEA